MFWFLQVILVCVDKEICNRSFSYLSGSFIHLRKGEGFSGTSVEDTWTKPKGGRIKGGKWGCLLYTSDAADDPRVV